LATMTDDNEGQWFQTASPGIRVKVSVIATARTAITLPSLYIDY